MEKEECVEIAHSALDTFGDKTNQTGYNYGDAEQFVEIAGDLITNLMHAADLAGVDPEWLLHVAQRRYREEA